MTPDKTLCSRCSFSMMVKCRTIMVKWVYDHKLISPSLTSISPSLTNKSTIIRPFDHHWEAAPTVMWETNNTCDDVMWNAQDRKLFLPWFASASLPESQEWQQKIQFSFLYHVWIIMSLGRAQKKLDFLEEISPIKKREKKVDFFFFRGQSLGDMSPKKSIFFTPSLRK